MAEPDKPYEITSSAESHKFIYPIIGGRKELSDKAKTIDPKSLTGLLNSRETDNREAREMTCYSIVASVLSLGANIMCGFGVENAEAFYANREYAPLENALVQFTANPAISLISCCMLTLAVLTVARAVGARMEAKDTNRVLLELEEKYKANNKNYNRLISS